QLAHRRRARGHDEEREKAEAAPSHRGKRSSSSAVRRLRRRASMQWTPAALAAAAAVVAVLVQRLRRQRAEDAPPGAVLEDRHVAVLQKLERTRQDAEVVEAHAARRPVLLEPRRVDEARQRYAVDRELAALDGVADLEGVDRAV